MKGMLACATICSSLRAEDERESEKERYAAAWCVPGMFAAAEPRSGVARAELPENGCEQQLRTLKKLKDGGGECKDSKARKKKPNSSNAVRTA